MSGLQYEQNLARLKMPDVPEKNSVWYHKKTRHAYIVVGVGMKENDLEPTVAYRRFGEPNAHWWFRPLSEFLDGRYEEMKSFVKEESYAC